MVGLACNLITRRIPRDLDRRKPLIFHQAADIPVNGSNTEGVYLLLGKGKGFVRRQRAIRIAKCRTNGLLLARVPGLSRSRHSNAIVPFCESILNWETAFSRFSPTDTKPPTARVRSSFRMVPHPPYNQPVTSLIPSTRRSINQTLLIDADDTLWENNIYFERAISSFISYLDHRVHTPEQVREHLNHCEHATIAAHGYGLRSFRRSLIACFEQLTDAPVTPEKHQRIVSFAQSIADQEIELLPGVAETLTDLATRHRLILVTKGDPTEQTDKLHRSGLAPHFSAVEVLPEKHNEAYLALAAHHACEATTTWMIGNSPKSDINPALGAGLHAVFIPHDFTWVLEHEVVNQPPNGQRLLELAAFAELTHHF